MSSSLNYGIIYLLGMENGEGDKVPSLRTNITIPQLYCCELIGLYLSDQTVASWDLSVLKEDTEISTDAECLHLSTDMPDCFC